MNTAFSVVIPARFASTRLPGKPLIDLRGKPMVVRVAERAALSQAQEICIATDHDHIEQVAKHYGFEVVRTQETHLSGTDRLCETAEIKHWKDDHIVVNVQGDEPLIEPQLIDSVASLLAQRPECMIATAAYPIQDAQEALNPNAVKVVCNHMGEALYFSRAPIPFSREHFGQKSALTLPSQLPAHYPLLRHIGIYAYRVSFLRRYSQLDPSPLEKIEVLEQLRALENGYRIAVHIVRETPVPGVDTPEDVERVLSLIA